MKAFIAIICGVLTHSISFAAMGILSSNQIVEVESYTSNKVSMLRATATQANFAFLGFHSTNEVAQAVADTNVLLVHSIGLERLRNYRLGDDFGTLIQPLPGFRLLFPLLVETNVRSSLAFHWIPPVQFSEAKLGQRKLIREVTSVSRAIPTALVKSGDAPFIVEVPVFDIWFVGYVNAEDKVVLLPTVDLRVGKLTIAKGQPLPDTAMLNLSVMASRYNGEPN
jgi:hypothetical protein